MEKIVIMVLITLTMGQAKEDLDTMKEMMAEMNERLDRTEAELAITKGALMSNIEELERKTEMMAEMEMKMNERLAKSEDDFAITKDELAITKADHTITKAKTDELEREVAILKAPPYIHSCGSHNGGLSGSSMTIPYTSL